MSKWEMVRLGDVGEVITGSTPPTSNRSYYESDDIQFYKPNDFKESVVNKLKFSLAYVSHHATNKIRLFPKGSVLTTCIGSIGKVGVLDNEATGNQQINAIIPNRRKVISVFLAYSILSKNNHLKDKANAPVVPIINKTQFANVQIPLPPLEVQQKIAQTLDAAAELLTLRKEQLAEMDNLIKAVFYEMFGDPVANEKGWQVIFVQDVYTIIDGDRGVNYPKQNDFIKDGYCLFLNTGNVTKEGFKFDDLKFISEEKDKELRKGKMERGDVILTTRGTVGNIAYYNKDIAFNVVRINSGMVILRNRCKEIHPLYFCELFKNKEMGRRISSFLSGTAQPQLPITNLKKIRFPLPPLSRQNKFAAIVTKIEEQKALVQKAIDESQYLFDSLMNEYFN